MLIQLIRPTGQLLSLVGNGYYVAGRPDDTVPSRATAPVAVQFFEDDGKTPTTLRAATGTLTFTAQPADGDTLTVGPTTYTAAASVSSGANTVALGSNLATFIANLIGAVNHSTTGGQGPGTTYGTNTVANPAALASAGSGPTILFTARVPDGSGNAVPTTGTSAAASFGDATLTGAPTLNFDIKPVGEYDADFTLPTPAFTWDAATGCYVGTLNTNTLEAIALLDPNNVDGANPTAKEPDFVPLMAQLSWGVPVTPLARSGKWTLILDNSVRHDDEGVPTPANPPPTPFGRGLLTSTDDAALRTMAGLGTAATQNVGTAEGTVADGGVANNSELARQRTIWKRRGCVLPPGPGVDAGATQESSVIYETGPRVIADTGVAVFKMWYTGGFDSTTGVGLCYAESYDGETWVRYTSGAATAFVLPNLVHGCVVKYGSTYYFMGVLLPAGTQANTYSSTDGISWTLAQSSAVSVGGTGWKQRFLGNMFLFAPETTGGPWQLLYEALDVGSHWSTGYASAPSIGGTWTDYGSNPVLFQTGGTVGGVFVTKVNGTYWGWAHKAVSGHLPCDIYRWSSPDLKTWTPSPSRPVLARASVSDGASSNQGQVADPWLVEVNGRTYMWYEGTSSGDQLEGGFRLKLAIAEATLAQLVAMPSEGAETAEPAVNAQQGNPCWFNLYFANQGTTTTVNDGSHTVLVWGGGTGGNGLTLAANSIGGDGNFYVPATGLYQFSANVQLNNTYTPSARFILQLLKNNVEPVGGRLCDSPLPPAVGYPRVGGTVQVYCLAGDVISVVAWPIGTNVNISHALAVTNFCGRQLQ